MIFSHHRDISPPARRRRTFVTTARGRRDHGYVLVQFALLLIPLMLMAGLSIDVGYWYNRASDIQKAADAAALAGVVWLPNMGEAIDYAEEAAKRNGFDEADTDIDVAVDRVDGTTRQLQVTITDDTVGSFFFEHLGGHSIELTRQATAEYLLPVPLGSPENTFGNDMDLPEDERAGLWGNIHGPRTTKSKGDAYAPQCNGGNEGCTTVQNPNYRPSGYLFTIDVGPDVSGLDIDIYDAGLYPRPNENTETGDYTWNDDTDLVTTTWTLYDKNGTPLVVDDNVAATSSLCASSSPDWDDPGKAIWGIEEGARADDFKNKYATICRIGGGVPEGRYLLRVQTSGGAAANRYALKAQADSVNQPRVSAYGDFSMYNNIDAGNANFYLAEVVPEHRGKTLVLDMFDPGEVSGDALMKVLEPDGDVAEACVGYSDSPNSTFTDGATLDPCQFFSSQGGSKYNDYWVQLQIKIPNDYTCDEGVPTPTDGKCWWKIQYDITGQANDTTTWAARVVGDPVHLIEEVP